MMEPEKVKAITSFMEPNNVKQLRSFLGRSNYYRKFIPNYSSLASPLTTLTKKSVTFQWNDDSRLAFRQLKDAISRNMLLRHHVLDKPFYIQLL